MRVIFAGQTGVEKRIALENLARFAARQHGLAPNLNHSETRRFVQVKILEDGIKEKCLGQFQVFLDSEHRLQKESDWREALGRILGEISRDAPKHVFLGLHGAYLRGGEYFACIDADLLREFRPTVFVTLIDDMYDIWQRIQDREEIQKTESYFELGELLTWRSVEIMLTDTLKHKVRTGQLRHFVVAVKHPTEFLYRLLFERDRLIVYGGCPITRTRDNAKSRDQVDRYRRLLRGHFTVFDPLTIDELRIDLDTNSLVDRWAVRVRQPLVKETTFKSNPLSKLPKKRCRLLRQAIGTQIESRDFRLVTDGDTLAGYRPHYGRDSRASRGLHREMVHAGAARKPMHVYHPPQDQVKGGVSVFDKIESAIKHSTMASMINGLSQLQEQKTERHRREGTRLTWE